MNNVFEQFTNQYSTSKTICFKLIPSEITMQNIEKNGFINRDFERYNNYKVVKKLFDDYHRFFIESSLKDINLDVSELYRLSVEFRNNKEIKKELDAEIKKVKVNIENVFKNNEIFEELFKNSFIEIVDDYTNNQFTDILYSFNGMTGYFGKYNENRRNVYNESIPSRIVEENFQIFVNNILKFEKVISKYPELKDKIISVIICNNCISNIFNYEQYCNFIIQNGIDNYNNSIGIINQFVNESYQKNEIDSKLKFAKLNKQILSDTVSSFVIENFDNIDDTVRSIKSFISDIKKDNFFDLINQLSNNFDYFDSDKVYIYKNNINKISNILFGDYNYIKTLLVDYADEHFNTKSQKNNFIDSDYFTVSILDEIIKVKNIKDILNFDFNIIDKNIEQFLSIDDYTKDKSIQIIKNMFDSIQDCKKIFDLLQCQEEQLDKDVIFYNEYKNIYDIFKSFSKLYNQVRNFFTKKNRNKNKVVLKFDNPIFGKGLAFSKEKDYKTFFFKHGNNFYIGIMNKDNMPKFVESNDGDVVQKYIFQSFSNPTKQVPRCCFTQDIKKYFESGTDDIIVNKEVFTNSLRFTKKIFDIYESKSFKNNIEDKNDYIDFIKHFFNSYKNIKNYYDLSKFKSSEEYPTLESFYEDAEKYFYLIDSINVSYEDIKQMELNNQLFTFQIYSKDFSKYRKENSNKNIHTLLFEAIFSEENKKQMFPFRLNGNFEIFFRKKSIDNPTIHKKGEKLLNKTDLNGNRIPNNIYMELFQFINGRLEKDISNEALAYMDKIKINEAHFDIVKDNRYTTDQFEIHLPMTLNALSGNKVKIKDFNEEINAYVKKNNCNIIGIDRGERNLLTYTVIDGSTGKEIEHGTLDEVNGVNYNNLLTLRSIERNKARKNWNEIEQIKELKSGYLSWCIHKICNLIVKYNAVICLERLNSKMKKSRAKIEKQIYNAFEKSLINKLSYMINDKKESIFNGKQLVCITDQMNDCIQNGIIYFVDPSYTSKVDPETGFANVFRISEITNNKKKIEFFSNFNSIIFDGNDFVFSFDYKKFNTWKKYKDGKFTVSSIGDRIKRFKNTNGYFDYKTIYPTIELKNIFSGIDYNINENLKSIILSDEQLCSKVFDIFKYIVTLRNTNSECDYIISPVKNNNGEYFDTRKIKNSNADTIASFNIATKGFLYINYSKLKVEDYFNHLKK